jgi:hemoglobin-like flavoprotein
MTNAATINASLDAVVAHVGDPGPVVYDRLFADYPDTLALFFLDRDGSRREHMLSVTFETLLDFIGDRAFAANMLRCEVINHQEFGVPPQTFTQFFVVMRDAFRDLLGAEWTADYDAAWTALLNELAEAVTVAA